VNLLVVGGSGFIGRNFLSTFKPEGHPVASTYHADESFPEFAGGLDYEVRTIRCDLLDESNDFSAYDTALYLAGNSNHGWAGQHPAEDLALNGAAMARFLQSFRGHLVLLSSAAVYLGNDGLVGPSTVTHPLFPYAISKLASELYAQWARAEGRLVGCTVLRLYYTYGPGEEARRLIFRTLTEFGLRGATRFTVNGDGRSLMGPIHVSDLARALGLVVRSDDTSGVYDVMGERAYSVNEIVSLAASVSGVEAEIEHVATNEDHLGFYSDPNAFAQAFEFQPAFALREGMEDYLRHLRNESAS
jgi:nucleoside-diphosphate-sugar epimerase